MSDDPSTGEATIRALLEAEEVPTEGGDPVFDAPWQARTFGLTVALNEGRLYEWQAFQERFADEIAGAASDPDPDAVEEDYYERWLAAFERLLIEEGHLTAEELDRRATEFERGDRTAEEFVEGHHEH